jgi:cytochrome c oxidase assembly protein subunit 15
MKSLYKIAIIVLVNIYLVTIAGSVVRMTGSGMGCPDWPKCFGYWMPPSSIDQLTWKKHKEFKQGQIIVSEEGNESKKVLLVANNNFKASDNFSATNWDKYTKHDYAKFNKYHTWTEYINRLCGALLGFVAFGMLIISFKFWKKDKGLAIISFLQVFFIGFEAWLGKLTVESNLAPVTLTYHMLGVIVLIILQVYFLKRIKNHISLQKSSNNFKKLKPVILIASLLLIVQIVMGSQVRQQVDIFIESGIPRKLIPNGFSPIFYVHRSYSILLVLIIGYIIFKLWNVKKLFKTILFLIGTLVVEIFTGMFLFYLGMQAYGQPFHLTVSLIMLGLLVKLYYNFTNTEVKK